MRVRQLFASTAALTLLMAGTAAAQVPPPTIPPTPPVPPSPATVVMPRLPDLPPMPMMDPLLLPPGAALAMDDARFALDSARFQLMDLPRPFAWDQSAPPGQFSAFQSDTYISGKELLNSRKYEEAIARFDRVIAQKTANADGALYWKAYAQFKLGKSDDALASITQLRRDHAQSRYLTDAKALEGDVRRNSGQPVNPAADDTDEQKLLAMQGLMRTDPERTIPQIENVLTATNSLRVKKNALYLLALSTQPRARQILLNYAKGSAGNPDLQLEAIRYLVANRDKQPTSGKDLMDIYQSTQDVQVRMAVISALRSSGDQAALLNIVSSGQTPIVIRQQALSSVSGTISPADLWTLYEKETNRELKSQIISAFANAQAVDQLSRIARTEKDTELRRSGVRALGRMKTEKTGQLLVDLYSVEQDVDTRRTVISALASQSNAEGLVAIARKETTLALKTDIVRRLSDMAPKSKVAADYLMEIIK
jgi:HEAT repeat protein